MHIVAVAWIFVVVLMAAAEASSTQGTVLGALFTLLLYGALPLGIVLYVMGTPARRRARQQSEALQAPDPAADQTDAASAPKADADRQTPADRAAAEGKETRGV